MSKNAALSAKQLNAIYAILQTTSIKKAAKKSGVARASIYLWMKRPEFKEELDRQRLELFNEGMNLLKTSAKKAAQKLLEFLDNKDQSLAKFASREILNLAIKAAEIQDIEKRIERLEDKLI